MPRCLLICTGADLSIRRMGDDDLFCARVAAEIGGIVVDVDYAVTPEYVFPTAFEQVWDVAEWAFAHAKELGADSNRISIGGHSAGGALTAAICLRAAKTGNMKFALQILDYAALDNAMSFEPGGNEQQPRVLHALLRWKCTCIKEPILFSGFCVR